MFGLLAPVFIVVWSMVKAICTANASIPHKPLERHKRRYHPEQILLPRDTMKSSLTLVASACAVFEASSFVIRSSRLPHQKLLSATTSPSTISALSDHRYTKPTVLHSATVGQSETRDGRSSRPRRTPTINEQLELETIRKELINKYVSLGHSIEDATSEVEYFLADEERCREYVEMRRKAMARGDDLGIEMIVQFAGAFLFGWMVSAMANNFHEIHQVGLMSAEVFSFSRYFFEFQILIYDFYHYFY